MSEGCSIADRAAPASQLVTSYSPLHRFARPSSQGGEDEERNEDEKRCYGEVLPYIWLKSDIWKAVFKQNSMEKMKLHTMQCIVHVLGQQMKMG